MFDFDYIFGDLFHTILPFDYEAFKKSSVKFYAGATDIQTGLPVFLQKMIWMNEWMSLEPPVLYRFYLIL